MFTCKRCGKCCMDNLWIKGLAWQEKQDLLVERKKHPNNDGCRMLYFKNDKAVCLVEELLGRNKKPEACRNYPKVGESCLSGCLEE